VRVRGVTHRKQRNKQGLIFVISGPSGSGKTTLVKKLVQDRKIKQKLIKSISFTTRDKRSGEQSGKDYFFITEAQFRHKQNAKKILEWTKYLGYYYATSKEFVEEQVQRGKHIVLCLDLKGAARIKKFYPDNTKTIFILPPSLGELRGRIEKRCAKTKKEEIKERLRLARRELLASHVYDYCIVNKNLSQAARELKRIVLREASI
jgi:guanylate kinase